MTLCSLSGDTIPQLEYAHIHTSLRLYMRVFMCIQTYINRKENTSMRRYSSSSAQIVRRRKKKCRKPPSWQSVDQKSAALLPAEATAVCINRQPSNLANFLIIVSITDEHINKTRNILPLSVYTDTKTPWHFRGMRTKQAHLCSKALAGMVKAR